MDAHRHLRGHPLSISFSLSAARTQLLTTPRWQECMRSFSPNQSKSIQYPGALKPFGDKVAVSTCSGWGLLRNLLLFDCIGLPSYFVLPCFRPSQVKKKKKIKSQVCFKPTFASLPKERWSFVSLCKATCDPFMKGVYHASLKPQENKTKGISRS